MTATLTQMGKQFQQDWTSQLEPDAIVTACRRAAYRRRERILNEEVTPPGVRQWTRRYGCG
jgi:hypothetical protein